MLLRQIISEKLLSTPAGTEFDVHNTLFFNILAANPLLARFYADLFRRHGANPSLIKDLETRSANFFAPDQPTKTLKQKKGSNMAVNPNTRVPVLTSKSTASAAARPRSARKSSVIS